MKVKSKATGEIYHERNDLAQALARAGAVEIVDAGPGRFPKPGDAKPPVPKWTVAECRTQQTDRPFLALVLEIGANRQKYFGSPENAQSFFRWPIPEDKLALYKKTWDKSPNLRGPQARFLDQCIL